MKGIQEDPKRLERIEARGWRAMVEDVADRRVLPVPVLLTSSEHAAFMGRGEVWATMHGVGEMSVFGIAALWNTSRKTVARSIAAYLRGGGVAKSAQSAPRWTWSEVQAAARAAALDEPQVARLFAVLRAR